MISNFDLFKYSFHGHDGADLTKGDSLSQKDQKKNLKESKDLFILCIARIRSESPC